MCPRGRMVLVWAYSVWQEQTTVGERLRQGGRLAIIQIVYPHRVREDRKLDFGGVLRSLRREIL